MLKFIPESMLDLNKYLVVG